VSAERYQLHWLQVLLTLLLSIIIAVVATVFLSIYWFSNEPTERMAFGAINAIFVWLVAMIVGFLAANSWRVVLWLGGGSLLLAGLAGLSLLG